MIRAGTNEKEHLLLYSPHVFGTVTWTPVIMAKDENGLVVFEG
jgi:hypothetical protein